MIEVDIGSPVDPQGGKVTQIVTLGKASSFLVTKGSQIMQINDSIATIEQQAGLYQIKIALYVTANKIVYESLHILTIEIVGKEEEKV